MEEIYISAAIDHDIQSEVSDSVVVQTQLYIQTHAVHPNSLYAILMRFFFGGLWLIPLGNRWSN